MTQPSRLLITGGHVFTPAGIVEEQVLIVGGVITAIGAETVSSAADAPDSPGAVEIDARGGLVSPGFQDSHIHPHHAELDMIACDLTPYVTADGYLGRITEYADANPDLPWITGGGWSMDSFPGGLPTAAALDALGFQLHYLARGDRGVRESLDAIEAAREANSGTDLQHTLAHIQVINESLEEAAADLYAPPFRRFTDITLPLIRPAVISGALLAFTLSLDNTVVSSFVSVAGSTPWPVYISASLKASLRPEIAAMSTLMLVLTLVVLGIVALILRRGPAGTGGGAAGLASTMVGR